MNPPTRRRGLALALLALPALLMGLLGAAAPSQAAPATHHPHADAAATYRPTAVVRDYDHAGRLVAVHTIRGRSVPIGTSQTLSVRPPRARGNGIGGGVSPSGCRTATVTNVTTTTLGFTAFRFITETSYCWNLKNKTTTLNGVTVTTADIDAQYRYRGLSNSFNQNTGDGTKRIYRQGHFENCVVKYGCINSYYPSNDTTIVPSGFWTWTTNG